MPVTGGIAALGPFLSNSDFFTSGAQLLQQTFGAMKLAKDAGKKKVGVLYCKESTRSSSPCAGWPSRASRSCSSNST